MSLHPEVTHVTTDESTAAYARAAMPGESLWFGGCLLTLLAEGGETMGQLSAAEAVIRKGMEPPPHAHTREDEAFYIVSGQWTFQIGDEIFEAAPGAFVWAPRGVEHSWTVDADGARALILTTPGGHLEAMMRPFSEPAATLELPAPPDAMPMDAILANERALGINYGAPATE